MDSTDNADSRRLWKWYAALIAPFLLNDFGNIYVHDFLAWLAIDFVFVKAFPILVIIYLFRSRLVSLDDIGLRKICVGRFVFWTITMAVIGYCIIRFGRMFLYTLIPVGPIGHIPWDVDSIFSTIDLYVGMLLVGVVEELIYRGLTFTILRKSGFSIAMTFVVSSLLFGLIHWSFGLVQFVVAAIFGAVYMLYRWKSGTITPLIFAHFAVDYVIFSGIIT
jgi:hypothetical protein